MAILRFAIAALAVASLVSASVNTDDLICVKQDEGGHDCYPRVFQPTSEFQVIRPGQELPKGLHIRLNMQTGEREAKLATKEDEHEAQAVQLVAEVSTGDQKDGESHPITFQQNDVDDIVGQYLKQKTSKSSLTAVDRDAFTEFLEELHKTSSLDELSTKLDQLEEIAHHVDYAFELVKSPLGIPTLVDLLSHPIHSIRSKTAVVLGNAVQNNPAVQAMAMKAGLLPVFLDHLATEAQPNVVNRLLYGLSSLVRSNPNGLAMFHQHKGLTSLMSVFNRWPNTDLRRKIFTIVSDLINPDMMDEHVTQAALDAPELEAWCGPLTSAIATSDMVPTEAIECYTQIRRRVRCAPSPSLSGWVTKQLQSADDADDIAILKSLQEIL
ncbi:nucleotide exchange factor sil1 [Quaeritorhiza haematococci]|nr:nucleotide exchange factor sil1 [Quaeritorhiza haematococci]